MKDASDVPVLTRERLIVSAEAFDRILAMDNEPCVPSPALIALMRNKRVREKRRQNGSDAG
jgi:uncharacterized protein (DUF1778 family)